MNIEHIIKLLRSENEDDNTIGFQLLIKKYGSLHGCNTALEETNLRLWQLSGGALYLEIHGVVGNRIREIKNHGQDIKIDKINK